MRMVRALVASSHPEPAVAVTAVVVALSAGVGRDVPGLFAAGSAVLAGQLSVGWANDYVDRDRDAATGRTDKPVATGAVSPRAVRAAALVAVAACVPLSLLSGLVAGLLHLVAVAFAWAYNLGLKSTPVSVLPYAVAFGIAPAFAVTGLPSHPAPPVWLVATGSLLGSGAHFANTLPDLAGDAATGVRGLPHRLGRTGSAVAAGVLLLAASCVLAFAPPGHPRALDLVGFVLAGTVLAAGLWAGLSRPDSRWAFRSVLVAAGVDVVLLLAAGGVAVG
ncbi:MAG: UbiA family prenyltransferase [Mycobacteriales bacterium]